MSISRKIKMLCTYLDISVAELARRIGTSPQNMNSKMKLESFTSADLHKIAEAAGCAYEQFFVMPNGDRI